MENKCLKVRIIILKEYIRYFPQESGRTFSIEISGKSWCDGSYRIRRDHSPVWVLEYIVSGQGTINYIGSKNKTYHPTAGDVYLLPVGSKHVYASDAKNPWIKLFVNCSGAVVDSLARVYGLEDKILFKGMQELEEKFMEIYRMMKNRELLEEDILEKTELIIHDIFRSLSRKSREENLQYNEIGELKKYLDANINRIVSVKELGKQIYRSTDYVIKHFQAETGMTPYQYFLKRKMQIAHRMLTDTALPVKEVAAQLGYTDAQYFSGVFKKEYGIPPRKFRRMNGKGV